MGVECHHLGLVGEEVLNPGKCEEGVKMCNVVVRMFGMIVLNAKL